MTKSRDSEHKVYARSFFKAKVKCMKDYMKPCVREKDPNHVILHVGTGDQNLNHRAREQQDELLTF